MATKPRSYFEFERDQAQRALQAAQDEPTRRRLTAYLVWINMHLRWKALNTRQPEAGYPAQLARA